MSKETFSQKECKHKLAKAVPLFWKISLLSIVVLSGCSGVTYNAQMCDKIASDPNTVLPKECVEYKEKDAEKAFNKTKKTIRTKEDLEFSKEKE